MNYEKDIGSIVNSRERQWIHSGSAKDSGFAKLIVHSQWICEKDGRFARKQLIRERKLVRGIDSGFIEILSEIDEIESKSIFVFANPLFLRESIIFFANPLWINNLFCEFTIHSRLHFGFTIFFAIHYGFTIYFANPLWIHDLFREFTLSFITESNVLVLNSLRTNSFYRKYTLQNGRIQTLLRESVRL